MLETIAFYVLSALAIGASALVIGQRNPMYSVVFLIASFAGLSGLYIQLDAPFVAVAQIIIYAGAIMVLFLFVIMLLNLGRAGPSDVKGPVGLAAATILAGVLMLQLRPLGSSQPSAALALPEGALSALQQQQGLVGMVARPLFETYLIPFEITSLLLLAAVVGAVVLAKRKL
jgi:NADH-quinone oxidoreductase subunit J